MNLSKFLRVFFVLVLFSNNVLAYDESVDHLLEGTLIYSGSATSAAMVFDDDPSTYYSTSSSTFQWVGLDLGEPHVITRIDYMPAGRIIRIIILTICYANWVDGVCLEGTAITCVRL